MLYLVLWHALVVCASECLRPTRPLMRSYSSAHEFKPCSILHHGCIFETKTLTLADTLMQPHSHTLMHTCACLLMRRNTYAHIHRQRQRRIQTERSGERERPAEYSRPAASKSRYGFSSCIRRKKSSSSCAELHASAYFSLLRPHTLVA